MLHADAHFGSHLRLFGQLKSGLTHFKSYAPEVTEEDQLDLHQAFVDVGTGPGPRSFTLRLGRQEMSYGSSLRNAPGHYQARHLNVCVA
jgi:hypothetical protein